MVTPELDRLREQYRELGVTRMLVKELAPNDNSKNQIYLGGSLQAANVLPTEEPVPSQSTPPRFFAKLRMSWLDESGRPEPAPGAQLILYPQYPEVRLSGFLKGCKAAPKFLGERGEGRLLILGTARGGTVIAVAFQRHDLIAIEYRSLGLSPTVGVFAELPVAPLVSVAAGRGQLLRALARIHSAGWIDGKRLARGMVRPYNAPNGGGFTLEAELGIEQNSLSKPDFMGWEVKAHTVHTFGRSGSGVITLMTPEPTGGVYRDQGVLDFLKRFGYSDTRGRLNRLNFGGTFRFGIRDGRTGLTLVLNGYDATNGLMTDANGGLVLRDDSGREAAIWPFEKLLGHWKRKHALAAYVPHLTDSSGAIRRYYYGNRVQLAQGTDFNKFLRAVAAGSVYYDPGIKVEDVSGVPRAKKRNQFRIRPASLPALYDLMEMVDTLAP